MADDSCREELAFEFSRKIVQTHHRIDHGVAIDTRRIVSRGMERQLSWNTPELGCGAINAEVGISAGATHAAEERARAFS